VRASNWVKPDNLLLEIAVVIFGFLSAGCQPHRLGYWTLLSANSAMIVQTAADGWVLPPGPQFPP